MRQFENYLLVPQKRIRESNYWVCQQFFPNICLASLNQLSYHTMSAQLQPWTHQSHLAIIFCRTVFWVGPLPLVCVVCWKQIYSYWQPFSQLSMLNLQRRQSLKESSPIGCSVRCISSWRRLVWKQKASVLSFLRTGTPCFWTQTTATSKKLHFKNTTFILA